MSQDIDPTDSQIEDALPRPTGYKILIALPEVAETFGDSGILKPTAVVRQDEVASVVALVLDLGPDAYADKDKFPSGAWCKPGDYVLVRAYSGTRFKVYGKEFRLINDDTVEGVVANPAAYSRI
jgi:co-chaperonin GroES (HSP10)